MAKVGFFERLDFGARAMLVATQACARETGSDEVTTRHLAVAFVASSTVRDQPVVGPLDVDFHAICEALGLDPSKIRLTTAGAVMPFTDDLKAVVTSSANVVNEEHDNFVGAEHFLAGLVRSDTEGGAALRAFGIDPHRSAASFRPEGWTPPRPSEFTGPSKKSRGLFPKRTKAPKRQVASDATGPISDWVN